MTRKHTSLLVQILNDIKGELLFIASYLPSKRRLFLGLFIGVIFASLTSLPLLGAFIFGCMIVEDAIDCTIDVRACLLLLVVLLYTNDVALSTQLLYLALFLFLFQSFHYFSGKTIPKEDVEEVPCNDGDEMERVCSEVNVVNNTHLLSPSPSDKPKDESALIREEIIHLRNLTPTLPLLPFLGAAILLCEFQPFIHLTITDTFSDWLLLLVASFGVVFLYFLDKKKTKAAELVGLERIHGFGDGDVLILAVLGMFFQSGVIFVLWVSLVLMIVAYVVIAVRGLFMKRMRL